MKFLYYSLILSTIFLIKSNNAGLINSQLYANDDELILKWNNFKIENNLELNGDEEQIRFQLFKEDYLHVKLHNKEYENNKETFVTCVNQFSVMSQDEYLMKFTIQKMGSMSLLNITEIIPEEMPPPSIEFDSDIEVPESFDWRTLNYVSKPQNQKKCGGCWAFASASAVETLYAQKYGKLVELSKQELIDCTSENLACDGGWPVNGFYHAYTLGLIEDNHYPYVSQANNCSIGLDEKKRYKIKGYSTIPYGDEETLKRVVATHGPVTIAIDASDWGFSHYSNGIYTSDKCKKDLSNHAALIVGYGREDNQDYWIVKNSWGEEWGLNGYIKMARNRDNMCGIASVAVYAFL